MKNFLLPLLSVLALAPALIHAIVPPGASTPEFYLVASAQGSAANLLPVRTSGGAGGYATLSGTAPIGIYYFYQGSLVAVTSPTSTSTLKPLIAPAFESGCTTWGQLGFGSGSTNKCVLYNSFYIESDSENSQLGAALTFNFAGGFYACGSGLDIYYQVSPSDGPPNLSCTPINLWTVPV